MSTPRTLVGVDALALATLHDLRRVLVDGVETALEHARVVSYDRPEAVTIAWTPAPRGWTPKHVQSLLDGRQSMRRADRRDARDRRHAAHEEYVAAAALAKTERELYDAQSETLRAAGWRESRYDEGKWYRLDPATGMAQRVHGRVPMVSRAAALATLGAGL